jgi:hypothetical protein
VLRTDLFALYGIVGTAAVSLGTLAAGLPSAFQRVFSLDQMTGFQVVFGGYLLLSLIAALFYGQLWNGLVLAPLWAFTAF